MSICMGFAGFGLTGCSTSDIRIFDDSVPVQVALPINQFILPETQGDFLRGKAQLAFAGAGEAKIVSDLDDINYSSDPETIKDYHFLPGLEVGLAPYVDFYYLWGFGVKIQFIGAPRGEAKPKNFSLSGAIHLINIDDEVDARDQTGSVKHGRATIEGNGNTYAVIAGYRTNDRLLYYSSIFYTDIQMDNAHILQTNNTDFKRETDLGAGEGRATGINFGISFDSSPPTEKKLMAVFGIEAGIGSIQWKKVSSPSSTAKDKNVGSVGLSAGITW